MIKNKNHKKRRSFFRTIIAHLMIFVQKPRFSRHFLTFFLVKLQFVGRYLAPQIIVIA